MSTAESVLLHLCQSVVENPEAVAIQTETEDEKMQLNVTVGDGDMGRVIGRRGRVANAIRTIVNAAAAKDGVTAQVEFVE